MFRAAEVALFNRVASIAVLTAATRPRAKGSAQSGAAWHLLQDEPAQRRPGCALEAEVSIPTDPAAVKTADHHRLGAGLPQNPVHRRA